MEHYRNLQDLRLSAAWLTIGVFDGVHRGHQKIIAQLTAGASQHGMPAVLLTFSPHPAQVLAQSPVPCLHTPEERAECLAALGVDVLITQPFTPVFAQRSAEDFMTALKERLGLHTLLVGYDFALGRGRAGNFERLQALGQALGYQVLSLPALQEGEEIISSTAIRQLLAAGQVRLAAELLSRPYAIRGRVVPGDGRGRTLGIPTANVEIPAGKAIPAKGVYACFAILQGKAIPAVCNLGLRPTFTDPSATAPRLEAHLPGWQGDLYGETLQIDFIERLRGEEKFHSPQDLLKQIKQDILAAQRILA